MAITPDGKTLYVLSAPNAVTPVSIASNRARPAIVLGRRFNAIQATALAIGPRGMACFVVERRGGRRGLLQWISTATNKVTATVEVGFNPAALAFSQS